MKLGLTTASFDTAIQGGRTNLVKIIESAANLGFEGLEIINKKEVWRKDISDDIKVNLVDAREKAALLRLWRKLRPRSLRRYAPLAHDEQS